MKELFFNKIEHIGKTNVPVKMGKGSELAMGIKAEHEHSRTIDKFKRKGVSDRMVETAIAKDHLKEDPHYYSKLAKMEQKFATGGTVNVGGVEVSVGDRGTWNVRGGESIVVKSISPKTISYFNETTGKPNSVQLDKFQRLFIPGATTTTPTTSNIDEKIKKAVEIFDVNKRLVLDLPPYLKYLAKLNQVKQGNKDTDNVNLDANIEDGNFDWEKSNEGLEFWTYVFEGDWTDPLVLNVVGSKEKLFELPTTKQTTTTQTQNIDDRIKEAIEVFNKNGRIVRDLPPYLNFLAKQNQVEQGNKEDDIQRVGNDKKGGNFNWAESYEKRGFWDEVNTGSWTSPKVLKVVGSKEKLFELPTKTTTTTQIPATPVSDEIKVGDVVVLIDNRSKAADKGARGFVTNIQNSLVTYGIKWIRDSFAKTQMDGGYSQKDFQKLYTPNNGLLIEDTVGKKIILDGDEYIISKVEFDNMYMAYNVYYNLNGKEAYVYVWKKDNQIDKFVRGEQAGTVRLILPTQTQQPTTTTPTPTQPKQWTLDDFKETKIVVDTPEKSTNFQNLIFELGGVWAGTDIDYVQNEDSPYLYVSKVGELTHGKKEDTFVNSEYREIFYDNIFPSTTATPTPTPTPTQQPTRQPIPKRKKKPFNKDLNYEALFDGYLVDKTKSMVTINQAQTIEQEMLNFENIIESLGI